MSQYGPPPDPPQPDEGTGAPRADGSGPAQQQPYNPYPTQWDQPSASAPAPVPAYGQSQGSPQPASYQQNPYGAPYDQQVPANPYAGTARPDRPVFGFAGYASWLTRVGAYVIDYLGSLAAGLPLWIGYGVLVSNTSTTTDVNGVQTTHYEGGLGLPLTLIVLGSLTSLAFYIWNICIRQGRTGASIGKSVLAIRLVNSDQQPIGGGWCFLRSILHIVDAIPCYLGYFWPIWDSRKQTFADKIMSTYVIHATEQQQRPY
jgi:uncharacterized RDD family membrane protein YckC